MGIEIKIRDAREDELPKVLAVVDEAYAQYEGMLPPEIWRIWSESKGETIFSGHGEIIVAEIEDEIVGAVQFYYDTTPLTLVKWPDGTATMRVLSVKPSARGRGVGRMLVDECIRRARKRRLVALHIVTTGHMIAAKRLYERMGFEPWEDFDGSAFLPEERIEAYCFKL